MERETFFLNTALTGAGIWLLIAFGSLTARWSRGRRGFSRRRSWEGPLGLGGGVGLIGLSCTYFGAFGLLLGQALVAWQRSALAAASALLLSWATRRAIRAYFRPALDQLALPSSGVCPGARGHVSVPIPRDGVGAVALSLTSGRVTRPARSVDGAPLPLRAPVHVVAVHCGAVIVRQPAQAAS